MKTVYEGSHIFRSLSCHIFQLELNIEPEKGWKTESMYAPAGVHVDAEYTTKNKDEEDFTGEQPFAYPMGVRGVMMNGCYGTNYWMGNPCYDLRTPSPNFHDSKLKQIAAKLLEMITRFQILNTKFVKICLQRTKHWVPLTLISFPGRCHFGLHDVNWLQLLSGSQ